MVIIHADGQTATNLNMFDNIVIVGREIIAERSVNEQRAYHVQLGIFELTEECQEQFDIITKEWALGRACYDMRIPKAFYEDKENE